MSSRTHTSPIRVLTRWMRGTLSTPCLQGLLGSHLTFCFQMGPGPIARIMPHSPSQTSLFTHSSMLTSLSFFRLSPSPP